MAPKDIKTLIKLQIEGGKATPAPPVGPALGQHGVNIMEFCKAYNDKTKDKSGEIIPVEITVYQDNSFTFVMKTTPASGLIKKKAMVDKGAQMPGRERAGRIKRSDVKEIAEIKMPDLNAFEVDSAMRMVAGTARSMGINVTGNAPWDNE